MNPAPSPHPAAQSARPGRRRVLASLGALPAGAVLASAASAQAAPSRGKRADGDFRLGVENLLEPAALETLRDQRVGLITNPTGADRELRSTIDLDRKSTRLNSSHPK